MSGLVVMRNGEELPTPYGPKRLIAVDKFPEENEFGFYLGEYKGFHFYINPGAMLAYYEGPVDVALAGFAKYAEIGLDNVGEQWERDQGFADLRKIRD